MVLAHVDVAFAVDFVMMVAREECDVGVRFRCEWHVSAVTCSQRLTIAWSRTPRTTLDEGGCGWICLNPGCPELAAGELEAEDLAGAGVSTSAGTGSDVEDEALAGRLARLVDHSVDAVEARADEGDALARARERVQAELARLHAHLLELGRLAEGAGALAAHLSDSLVVSYHSGDFAEAQEARQALTAVGALCVILRRTAGDAQDRLAGVNLELPGLLSTGDL